PESSYHYHVKALKENIDPDAEMKELIQAKFKEHNGDYGYRRITDQLRQEGHRINYKRVQRLMRVLDLKCKKFGRKSRKYNSYKGTVGKVAKNRIKRRFNTSIPLQKLTTDITEFKCLDGKKLYLNPILDMFNGEILSYGISNSPTLDFVLEPLEEALDIVKNATYRTTIHSDQGWHYQHDKWVKKLKQHKVFQSMSRKGNCIDNSPVESFFGILKQEMYHGESLCTYEELKSKIEDYIYYYNNKRIKGRLTGMSPVQYRIHTDLIVA
ncbi:IS3 family transposase, partial [Oceanobacillus bengalensis]